MPVRAPDRSMVAFWNQALSPYLGPETRKSLAQLIVSASLFLLSWTLAYQALKVGYWLTLLLSVPTAGFLMRLFMIQHDCGHGSFFRSRRARDTIGFWIGVLTLTPYAYWRKTHAYHHAHSGDLDHRGFGDIETLTVEEYSALSSKGRLWYRTYRHPVFLFGIGAILHFVFVHRYPWTTPREWKEAWKSVWLTNLALAGIVSAMALTIGLDRFLLVHVPIIFVTCSTGVWLFYVQHQFEDTYWHRQKDWDYYEAALEGSSFLVLPKPLQWLTANIGIHHVHHLNARIPNYRLEEAMMGIKELQNPTRVTIRDSLELLRLALWDEEGQRLIRFRDLRVRTEPKMAA